MYKLKVKLSSLLVFFMVMSLMSINISVSKVSAVPLDPHDVSQIVYFPDKTLEGIVKQTLNIPFNESVYKINMATMNSLSIRNSKITSFEGLKSATQLTYLTIDYSTVTDLTYLNNLTITQFTSNHTDYSNLQFLKTMPNLNAISINNTVNIDLDSISTLTSLKSVILKENVIPNLDFLTNFPLLINLDFSYNAISSLNFLTGNLTIETLIMHDTAIKDLSNLSTMANLIGINATNNNITQLPDLSTLLHLHDLAIENNPMDFSSGTNLMNLNLLKNKGVNVTYSPPYISQPPLTPSTPSITPLSVAAVSPMSTPEPVPAIDLVVSDNPDKVNFTTITKIIDNTASIQIDNNSFSKAINLLQGSNSEFKSINLNINQGSAANISVEIPASSIINANLNANGTTLNIISNNVSYALPLLLLSSVGKDSKVFITINSVDETTKASIESSLDRNNVTSTNKIYEFKIVENENGIDKEINNFGNVYVTRTVKIDNNSSDNLSYVYDATTKDVSYAPSVQTTVGETTYLEIKRNGNSIYGVAKTNHKEFNDTLNHWAKDDIDYLTSKTIIDGKTNSLFAPNDKITRAEIAKLIVKSLGLNNVQGNAKIFIDVKLDEWYADFINIASSYGLINGYKDSTFKPNDTLTKEQLSAIYSNILGFLKKSVDVANLNYSAIDKYKDAKSLDNWAKIPTIQMTQLNILSGDTSQHFKPNDGVTRAEVVTSLRKLLEYLKFID